MRFLIHVPVYKRYKTLELFHQNIVELRNSHDIEVVAVGSCKGDMDVCTRYGYHYVHYSNDILGDKFQAGIEYAKNLEFDAMVMLGSDDILSSSCLDLYIEAIQSGYDFIGFLDCYFVDLQKKNAIYWRGYNNQRKGEPIGAWRCFSVEGLNKMNWKLWESSSNSVDHQMWQKVTNNGLKTLKMLCKKEYRVVDLKNNENLTKFRKFENSIPVGIKESMNGFFTPQQIEKIIRYV